MILCSVAGYALYLIALFAIFLPLRLNILFDNVYCMSGHILGDDVLSRLISMPNVIVTSHQAFLTEEALNNIAETTVNNILSYFAGDGLCDNELCYRCGNIEKCRRERKQKCF